MPCNLNATIKQLLRNKISKGDCTSKLLKISQKKYLNSRYFYTRVPPPPGKLVLNNKKKIA